MTIIWDNNVPRSLEFGDIYYNPENGLEESRFVFLENNHLSEKFALNKDFRIVELGFGTGLNFLIATDLWQKTSSDKNKLEFFSVEKFPLSSQEIIKALSSWKNELYYDNLANFMDSLTDGFNIFISDNIYLHLFIGDIRGFIPLLPNGIDTWFLDGFAPSSNPEMWNEQIFDTMKRTAKIGTSFATFTSAGFVKRALAERGFLIERVKGYGRKRHMLRGIFKND